MKATQESPTDFTPITNWLHFTGDRREHRGAVRLAARPLPRRAVPGDSAVRRRRRVRRHRVWVIYLFYIYLYLYILKTCTRCIKNMRQSRIDNAHGLLVIGRVGAWRKRLRQYCAGRRAQTRRWWLCEISIPLGEWIEALCVRSGYFMKVVKPCSTWLICPLLSECVSIVLAFEQKLDRDDFGFFEIVDRWIEILRGRVRLWKLWNRPHLGRFIVFLFIVIICIWLKRQSDT